MILPRILVCTDHGRVTRDGNRRPKAIPSGRIAGGQFCLLHPAATLTRKDIGGSRETAGVVVTARSDDDGIIRQGNRVTELISRGSIAGDQLRLL